MHTHRFFLSQAMSRELRFVCFAALTGFCKMVAAAEGTKIPLTFSEGYDTDAKDRGRPVVLIAAALGVTPDVFREAFSGVTPARDGRPSGAEARANKEALMKVLKPHGITNERLDEVSDYYRYQPQKGGLWKQVPAKGHVIVEDGKVKQIVITEPGSGYSTAPKVAAKGLEKVAFKVTLKFDKDLKQNGAIKAVELAMPEKTKPKK
ncbi:hypothetical protein [Schlesneria paludicola]|uniref:hypothetical protein n=1 Tax=Schlesneria paludicola TaxID=360056 RepID=UPI00029A0128|nr:hypothetical protein [Schlesneria paludicola]